MNITRRSRNVSCTSSSLCLKQHEAQNIETQPCSYAQPAEQRTRFLISSAAWLSSVSSPGGNGVPGGPGWRKLTDIQS